mmetsp:Transcript_10792/g.16239  ORF Transcript_10792/g.16239 Transcript_10792/m.16239 type:complete len:224 (-) Transcript_10792:498-1169(-)
MYFSCTNFAITIMIEFIKIRCYSRHQLVILDLLHIGIPVAILVTYQLQIFAIDISTTRHIPIQESVLLGSQRAKHEHNECESGHINAGEHGQRHHGSIFEFGECQQRDRDIKESATPGATQHSTPFVDSELYATRQYPRRRLHKDAYDRKQLNVPIQQPLDKGDATLKAHVQEWQNEERQTTHKCHVANGNPIKKRNAPRSQTQIRFKRWRLILVHLMSRLRR